MTIPARAATANGKGQGWRLAGLLAYLKTRQSCRNLKNGFQAQPDSKGGFQAQPDSKGNDS